jgi:outer membrane protein OmpA-like peptidoglycan-associated protein
MPDTAPLDARLQPSPAPTAYSAQLSRPPARAASRRALTPAFYLDAAVPWVVALGLVTFRDEPGVLPALAVAIPSAMAVDLLTGAAWDRSPSAAPPPAPLPPPARSAQAPARDMDAEITADPALASLAATLLLRQMARAADAAGCNRVISEAWLDESELVRRPSAVSAADSVAVDERVEREVEEARAELGRLCARSNPLLDSLAAVQQLAARPATEPAYLESEAGAPEAPAAPEALCRAAAFGECITFPLFSAELPAGAGPGLDSLAARIRAVRLPVVVVIVGTADERGDPGVNRGLGHARATAVRDALVRRGVPADRLAVESCGSEARCQLVPGAAGESRGAELNRRVILQLRVRESTP